MIDPPTMHATPFRILRLNQRESEKAFSRVESAAWSETLTGDLTVVNPTFVQLGQAGLCSVYECVSVCLCAYLGARVYVYALSKLR